MKYFYAILTLLLTSGLCHAQLNNVDLNADGIYASGQFLPDWPGGACISITLHFNWPNTNKSFSLFDTLMKKTNGLYVFHTPHLEGIYFMATNSFCGIVSLRNTNNDEVPLLQPELNSPEAYPPSYSLRKTSRILASSVGLGPPLPYAISGSTPELNFEINRYFKIPSSGMYQLTVWPKIYKKISPTGDICERLDLPPVTIPIQWTGM